MIPLVVEWTITFWSWVATTHPTLLALAVAWNVLTHGVVLAVVVHRRIRVRAVTRGELPRRTRGEVTP